MLARLILGFPGFAFLGITNVCTAQNPSPGENLKATIALQGFPCDQVTDAKRNGDSDYTATCKDGNRYHIFVDTTGRVIVKKL